MWYQFASGGDFEKIPLTFTLTLDVPPTTNADCEFFIVGKRSDRLHARKNAATAIVIVPTVALAHREIDGVHDGGSIWIALMGGDFKNQFLMEVISVFIPCARRPMGDVPSDRIAVDGFQTN